MKTVSGFVLVNFLGWKIKGEFPNIKKSIIIFAPHTSYWDGLYGKLYLMQLGINYKFLSKKEFFKFPLNYFFKIYGSIPVSKTKEYIDYVVELINISHELHIVLSPEGQLAKTIRWKKGYYYMAVRANVPIVVGLIDYKKKEIGIKKVIYNQTEISIVRKEIAQLYSDVTAKYPENFSPEVKV
ncbi:MAG: 1-acyl-sn-glycerol-3-phosphate acyltransferase [Paludibacter sp.]|nr:1-acyl-sn-glycerol-3-phosphate acyltransferase [Paludibacter sp.]MDD4107475.1 1-acyl-sn-glycerol-3-phosphate acyltransferase [Prolixibacteraceae bacterium]